jgi:hypothetical protein
MPKRRRQARHGGQRFGRGQTGAPMLDPQIEINPRKTGYLLCVFHNGALLSWPCFVRCDNTRYANAAYGRIIGYKLFLPGPYIARANLSKGTIDAR